VNCALDASAVLAVLNDEPGAERVREAMVQGAFVSAVNLSEVVAKLTERQLSNSAIEAALAQLEFEVMPFDERQAHIAGFLRRDTREQGLSLGDRACLALAASERVPALTAERAWARLALDPPIEITMIR
jgi:ribonuclease VapC